MDEIGLILIIVVLSLGAGFNLGLAYARWALNRVYGKKET